MSHKKTNNSLDSFNPYDLSDVAKLRNEDMQIRSGMDTLHKGVQNIQYDSIELSSAYDLSVRPGKINKK